MTPPYSLSRSPSSPPPSPLPFHATTSQSHLHQHLQPTQPQCLTRRAVAGASGGIFTTASTSTNDDNASTHGYQYIWPLPPRYSTLSHRTYDEDQWSMARFIATVDREHKLRVCRAERAELTERERAVRCAVAGLAGPCEDVGRGGRCNSNAAGGGTDSYLSLLQGDVNPPPIPPRNPARGVVPTIEEVRDRLEAMSLYSGDSMSENSYMTEQLERAMEPEGRRPWKKMKCSGKGIREILKTVGRGFGGVGSRMERSRGGERGKGEVECTHDETLTFDDGDAINDDDARETGAHKVNVEPSQTSRPPTDPSSSPRSTPPGISALSSSPPSSKGILPPRLLHLPPIAPLFPLPIQPPNTPTTPTTPLTFARHSIPTLPNWDESPNSKQNRLSAGGEGVSGGTPERCNPLRMHGNVMIFAGGVAVAGEVGGGDENANVVAGLEEGREEEMRQGNEVFFWKDGLRGFGG